MKTAVADTSIAVHNDLERIGHLSRQEMELYVFLRENPGLTDREIEDRLGWRISTINGRRNGLIARDLVIRGPRRHGWPTGRLAYTWSINPNPDPKKVLRRRGFNCPLCNGRGHVVRCLCGAFRAEGKPCKRCVPTEGEYAATFGW